VPVRSKAQNALMRGVASGSIKGSDVPKSVAKEFVKASHGQNVKALPKHVKKSGRGR